MPLPPIPAPTRTIGNLGPAKTDLDRAPDDTHYQKAEEWNWAADYIIWLYGAFNSLIITGSTGTLWDAYLNHAMGPNIDPCRIFVDANNYGICVTDDTTPIGKMLLGVSEKLGTEEYGFWIEGLRLRDSVDAIHTATSIAIQMRSGQQAVVGAAYILDTVNPYALNQPIAKFKNGSAECFTWLGGGALIAHNILTGTTQWALAPAYDGTGKVRLVSAETGGGWLGPQTDGVGQLGDSNEFWGGVFSRFHATKRAVKTFAATLALDLKDGEWQQITLTADFTISAISNAQIGATLSLSFIQDGTGGYVLSLPVIVKTKGPFRLSGGANEHDVLTIRYDGTSWYEVGRYQESAPETRFRARTITTGATLLQAHKDAHTQEFQGVLVAASSIQIDPLFAVKGDKIELLFDETNGVETTAAFTLTIKIFGGATLLLFNQVKTLRGRLLLYNDGTDWKYSGSTSTTLDYS